MFEMQSEDNEGYIATIQDEVYGFPPPLAEYLCSASAIVESNGWSAF